MVDLETILIGVRENPGKRNIYCRSHGVLDKYVGEWSHCSRAILTTACMLGKKDIFMEVNRVWLSGGNRHLQSCTTLCSFMPAYRLFTLESAPTHCKLRETHTSMLSRNWRCHGEDTESWAAGDKGWGEWELERGAAKMQKTSIASVYAGRCAMRR